MAKFPQSSPAFASSLDKNGYACPFFTPPPPKKKKKNNKNQGFRFFPLVKKRQQQLSAFLSVSLLKPPKKRRAPSPPPTRVFPPRSPLGRFEENGRQLLGLEALAQVRRTVDEARSAARERGRSGAGAARKGTRLGPWTHGGAFLWLFLDSS